MWANARCFDPAGNRSQPTVQQASFTGASLEAESIQAGLDPLRYGRTSFGAVWHIHV
jgi:hypothetical protein